MLTLNFKENKKIKLDKRELICSWSRNLCTNKNKIDLKQYEIEDFQLVLRVMKLIEISKSEDDFHKNVALFSACLKPQEIGNLLCLIHYLQIVPPKKYKIIAKIPKDGSLANVIAPLMANMEKKMNNISRQSGGGNGGNLEGGIVPASVVIKALLS